MKRAWEKVQELCDRNAMHRRGFKLNEMTDDDILNRMNEELGELCTEPDDAEELADILGCIIHYAIKHSWTAEHLEQLMLAKFDKRFERPLKAGDVVLYLPEGCDDFQSLDCEAGIVMQADGDRVVVDFPNGSNEGNVYECDLNGLHRASMLTPAETFGHDIEGLEKLGLERGNPTNP